MHFVINMFIAAACFAAIILFIELLPKFVSILLGIVGCGTLAYAIAILVKKIGEWTSVWSGDYKYINSNFLWIFPIVLVVIGGLTYLINKRSKKNA